MKRILLLSTGGTMVSDVTEDGLAPIYTASQLVEKIPELNDLCEITCKDLMILDSSNLQPEHWITMAEEVYACHDAYDGFVIIHGQDTMAYSAAGLSIMIKNLKKSVVFTGSMLPLEAKGSDARGNIISAVKTALTGIPGVYITFGNRILDGRVAHKLFTEDFDAFRSINCEDAGRVVDGEVELTYMPVVPEEPIEIDTKLEKRVAVVGLIPGTTPALLNTLMNAGYKGIVIQAFGCGGVPNQGRSMLPCFIKAKEMNVAMVIASQCLYDGVDLTKYDVNVKAAKLGAISAHFMSPELTVVKLMWALGHHKTVEVITRYFNS